MNDYNELEGAFSKEEIEIFNKYPTLFRRVALSMTETCMCWGIDCPVAWYGVIDDLSKKIEAVAPGCVEYEQIKSKFDMLRVYYDFVKEVTKDQENQIDRLIEEAESAAFIIDRNL